MTDVRQSRTKISSRELIIIVLLVASAVINYVDRANLSMAMPQIEQRFSLSPLQIASLLGAFFWTYALLQLFGIVGWLSDRFQPGWVLFYGYLFGLSSQVSRARHQLYRNFCVAIAAGPWRVGCISVLLAHLCRDAAAVSRPRQLGHRRGHQDGAGGGRVYCRPDSCASWLAFSVHHFWSRRGCCGCCRGAR